MSLCACGSPYCQGCPATATLEERVKELSRQIEIMKPLVEAAITWKKKERWPYLAQGGFLAHAVDAYEKAVEPVGEREKA